MVPTKALMALKALQGINSPAIVVAIVVFAEEGSTSMDWELEASHAIVSSHITRHCLEASHAVVS